MPNMQLLNPMVNHAANANGNVGNNPKSTDKNAYNSSSVLMMNIIPCQLATLPKA